MSGVGAQALGFALQTDVHRTTVVRQDIQLRAALQAASVRWHKLMARCIAEVHSGGCLGWTAQVQCVRWDATNAKRWQQSKLHVAEVSTSCLLQPLDDSDTCEDAIADGVCTHTMLGDLQVVGKRLEHWRWHVRDAQ